MTSTNSLDALFQRFWEARRAGRPVSPAELCRECPELLEALRECIAREPKPMSKLVRRPTFPGETSPPDPGLRS
jgi:hypothetical protein